MKRYIKSNSYTPMDFDNKLEVMKWLDTAERRIAKACSAYSDDRVFYEIDDVSWGTNCFSIPIFQGWRDSEDFDRPVMYEKFDVFRFCYDADDVFERSAEEQLNDAIDEFLESFSYKVG